MAGRHVQVSLVLAATLLVAFQPGASSPTAGLGGLFAPKGSQPATAEGAAPAPAGFDPFALPKELIGALRPDKNKAPAHDHHHHHAPAAAATTAAPAATTAAPAATTAAPAATTAAPAATTTAAATTAAATTAAATAARTAAATSTAAPTAAPSTTTTTTEADQEGPAAAERSDAPKTATASCMQVYQQVINTTQTTDIDILSVLLDHGGWPGQLSGIQWRRFGNESRNDEWSYFYGDTDFKTFIRLEKGIAYSAKEPAPGTQPEQIEGDVWWSPDDFCGKLRHAKYTQDPELRASNQPQVCFIEGTRVVCWNTWECVEPLQPGVTCPRGGAESALLASLVG